jgi:proteasome assembly chaperone 4
MKPLSSTFNSHQFSEEITGQTLIFRILKMQESLFIYIGKKDSEELSALAIGFTSQKKESLSSSILESPESCDLAQKLSLRLNKPVFVSFNGPSDRITKPTIEQRLIKEITDRPEFF